MCCLRANEPFADADKPGKWKVDSPGECSLGALFDKWQHSHG